MRHFLFGHSKIGNESNIFVRVGDCRLGADFVADIFARVGDFESASNIFARVGDSRLGAEFVVDFCSKKKFEGGLNICASWRLPTRR